MNYSSLKYDYRRFEGGSFDGWAIELTALIGRF